MLSDAVQSLMLRARYLREPERFTTDDTTVSGNGRPFCDITTRLLRTYTANSRLGEVSVMCSSSRFKNHHRLDMQVFDALAPAIAFWDDWFTVTAYLRRQYADPAAHTRLTLSVHAKRTLPLLSFRLPNDIQIRLNQLLWLLTRMLVEQSDYLLQTEGCPCTPSS
jgi:hypothetical protein